jgi:hypothetical protein
MHELAESVGVVFPRGRFASGIGTLEWILVDLPTHSLRFATAQFVQQSIHAIDGQIVRFRDRFPARNRLVTDGREVSSRFLLRDDSQ